MNIPVIYEDDWLLVLDKPAGLLTIPTPKRELRTLTSIVNEEFKEKNAAYRLYPCHRLDRETSGLIVYAKGKSIQKKMMAEFWNKGVRKTYIAFMQGRPSKEEGIINHSIEGKSAVTRYRIIDKREDYSVTEIMPLTGRTNQIRIHFKRIGHPLVGETKFAFRRDFKLKAKRVMLHAKKLEFIHPVTGRAISLEAPLPSDMKAFIDKH